MIIVPVVLPLYTRDSTILTVLIDHCTRGSTLYTQDSTILTVLMIIAPVVLPLYTRDSTILTMLIDHCTRGSTSLYPRLYHSNSVN